MHSTLVLIHGWGFGPEIWEPLAAGFAGTDPHRPALPGYGGSGPSGDDATDWLECWAAALPADALVVGWSLGALIALQVAHRYPHKVRALGLIAGLPCFIRQPGWAAGWTPAALAAVRRRLAQDPDAARRYVAALAARGDSQAPQVRETLLTTAAPSAEAMAAGLDYLAEADERALLAALTIPVTIWLGTRDQLIGNDCGPALCALQPRIRVRELPDAGHAPLISQAGILAGELEALL